MPALRPGAVVAVYDLGGGTFDAAVLRRTATGFELLGQPEGIEHLGGVDVDAAVFSHVARALDGALDELDVDDPDVTAAVQRLRQECTQAKEALSADTDVTIPVLLPGLTTEVRLTRGELEDLIRPALLDSVAAMRRALRSAGVDVADLHSVLLVGGSSRIPLVSQLVATELGRPVAVDADPKHAVALGAACVAGQAQLTQVIPAVPRQATDPFAAPATDTAPKPVAVGAEAGGRRAEAVAPAPKPLPPAPKAPEPVAATPAAPKPAPDRPERRLSPRPRHAPEPTADAPTMLLPPAVVTSQWPLLVPPRQPAPPPSRWSRRRPLLVAAATVAAVLAGTAAAVALGDLDDRKAPAERHHRVARRRPHPRRSWTPRSR